MGDMRLLTARPMSVGTCEDRDARIRHGLYIICCAFCLEDELERMQTVRRGAELIRDALDRPCNYEASA